MKDAEKIRERTIRGLAAIRRRIGALETPETHRRRTEQGLERIERFLRRSMRPESIGKEPKRSYVPPRSKLTRLDASRLLLDSVGQNLLREIATDYLDLLETSGAIYEKNGDYALAILSSGWFRLLSRTSRDLCGTDDDREALNGGKWHCHESCWTEAAEPSMETARAVDIQCRGGLRLYSVPIRANGKTVGAMTLGYGDPPKDPQKLGEVAERYGVSADELRAMADSYESRPPLIVEIAKDRLRTSARLIGAIVERNKAVETLQTAEANFRHLITRNADGIVIADRKGIVDFVNPAAEVLFGRKGEEILGQPFGFPITSGKAIEVEITGENSEVTTAEMRVAEIEWEGESVWLASLRDITERKQAAEELKQDFERLRRIFEETVGTLASAVEMRDPYTAGHQRRVAKLASAIAKELGLSEDQIAGIHLAGLVHDVGKLSIPAEILNRPTRLTEVEQDIVRTHPRVGHDILKSVEFPWPVAQAVLQHHERMDGSGYPQGLSGKEILLEARILGVADVIEAMSYPRPWGQRLGIDKALEEISQNSGILYDPETVDACLMLFAREWMFEFKGETGEMSEKTKEFAERHRRRFEFWKGLLAKSKKRTRLHLDTSPSGYNWIGTSAGKSGLGYNYVIAENWGAVELYIDRGKDEGGANKQTFDALYAKKEEIEGDFGASLAWERLDGKRACRIEKRLIGAGLKDKEDWDDLQDKIIDAMVRLERSLKKHIAKLPI